MGIQINGQTDIISAADGSLTISGADLTSAINFSVSGVGTIATLIVTGNASIGGTVTYMDVTNVDSVGIITAQQGIQVLTNGINVVGVSTLSGGVNASQGADLARLRVTGITTLSGGVNASQGIDAAGLRVTGIATHGQTTTTGFSNAGVSTLGNATATTLVVSGFSTHGATSATLLSVSGVTTVAAGSVSAPSITPTGDSNTGIFFPSADTIAFGEGGAEALRINSSGNVGIGTDNPLRIIDVRASSSQNPAYILKNTGNTTTGANSALSLSAQTSSTISAGYGPALAFEHRDTSGAYAGALISSLANADPNGADLVLSSRYYGYVEGLRITSSGNVGIGLTNPQAKLDVNGSAQFGSNVVNTTSIQKLFTSSHDATNRTAKIRFGLNDGSFSGIEVENVQGSNSSYNSQTVHIINHNGGVLGDIKSLTARFDGNIGIGTDNPTAKLHVSGGDVLIAKTSQNTGTNGFQLIRDADSGIRMSVTRTTADCAVFNRNTDDGVIISILQDGTLEGTISVSGSTVSYNGAHLSRWSQLPSGAERTEILRGSVLSNLDEMCEWGEEDNEQLNRMKVSDVEGDKNVAGVFQCWDDDDDTYTNDFYCAMTGDFIIRIAEGVTVERGDLLMSAGDGTAKPQDDDIIRSKTIAKVTSTSVTCTYEDGSYCVPCVLMAC